MERALVKIHLVIVLSFEGACPHSLHLRCHMALVGSLVQSLPAAATSLMKCLALQLHAGKKKKKNQNMLLIISVFLG
jgi:hypothetical protein